MFGYKPRSAPPRSSIQRKPIGDFNALLNEDYDSFDGVTFGDDELEDPELLRELACLTVSSPKPRQAPKRASAAVDLDAYARLASSEDVDMDNIEVSEEDLNDPTLLAQLQGLGNVADSEPEQHTQAHPAIPPASSNTHPIHETTNAALQPSTWNEPAEEVSQLSSMGFNEEQSRAALRMADGDIERATNMLLDESVESHLSQSQYDANRAEPTPQSQDHSTQNDTHEDDLTWGGDNTDDMKVSDTTVMPPPSSNDNVWANYPTSATHVPAAMQPEEHLPQTRPDTSPESPQPKTTPPQASPHNSEIPVDNDDFDSKMTETNLNILDQYIKDYKTSAVVYKKSDDLVKALEMYRKSKQLQVRRDEIAAAQVQAKPVPAHENSPIPPAEDAKAEVLDGKQPSITPVPEQSRNSESSPSHDLAETVSSVVNTASVDEEPPSSPPKVAEESTALSPKEETELTNEILRLQQDYKSAAIHYKKIGNLSAAKEMVAMSRRLLDLTIRIRNKDSSVHGKTYSQLKSLLPTSPNMDLSGPAEQPKTVKEPDALDLMQGAQTFEGLAQQLERQKDVCHNLSLQERRTGTYTGESPYKALMNTFSANLATLASMEAHRKSLPQFHYQAASYRYKTIHADVALNEMIVEITKATGLGILEVPGKDVEAFVTFDMGGWPPEGSPQASLGKGETRVAARGPNAVFNYRCSMPINRNNRAFHRYIQRKKATFSVFHNAYSYGFFRRPVFLGKVAVELDGLQSRSSIEVSSEKLVDANRKRTGGTLDLRILLREPLSGEDVSQKLENWLIIDEFDNGIQALLEAAKLIPQGHASSIRSQSSPSSPPPAQSSRSSEASNHPPSTAPAVTKPSTSSPVKPIQPEPVSQQNKPASASSTVEPKNDLESAIEEFNSVDSLVSNMVLEHEVGLVDAQIAACTSKSLPVPEEIADRKQALDIKINLLVIQVQTGQLTMDAYLRQVESRIARDIQLALLFKKAGNLELAARAMKRRKIMQEEVDEVKQAQVQEPDA
ncbi:hypothetical protein BZG36_03831 [Bifiguratus adelaidae]|uniref:UBA domain-containing protein n=1 Tax=Bifiguratus adelaidae TaxID=1938954 RepID=A0A261XW65_9FUNG|nr:hypothetical protein BZG36_03831 [Bifiguratus adelaidae]